MIRVSAEVVLLGGRCGPWLRGCGVFGHYRGDAAYGRPGVAGRRDQTKLRVRPSAISRLVHYLPITQRRNLALTALAPILLGDNHKLTCRRSANHTARAG